MTAESDAGEGKARSQGPATHMDELREAVRRDPTSSSAHVKLGAALLKANHLEEAEELLRKAIELDPGNDRAWTNMGGVHFSRFAFEQSIEANQKAVALNPQSVKGHFNLGLGYLYLGKAAEMLPCFQRVLEIDPQNPGGHYHLAVALNALGRVEEANISLHRAEQLGYRPQPELMRAIEKAMKNKVDGGGVLSIELGKDPSESGESQS